MKPLPYEGGFYVETYRCDEKITQVALPTRYSSEKNFSTAILYLLTPDTFSAFHRLRSDEIFHFYLGDSVTMLQLHPDGSSEVTTLGQDIMKGQRLQVTVPPLASCRRQERGARLLSQRRRQIRLNGLHRRSRF